MHSRCDEYDLFVTVLRRKYIPPLMEVFQDLICMSTYSLTKNKQLDELQLAKKSEEVLKLVHQVACDSLYCESRFTAMYKNIIDEKANALLMDDQTVDFYHYNLNILPSPGIIYASLYLECILNILGKYNNHLCKDLKS